MKNSSVVEVRQIKQNPSEEILAVENLIKGYIQRLDEMNLEIKRTREMFDDGFNNNPTYREANEKVKEVTKAKASLRQQILKQPSVAKLNQKLKDLRFDKKELEGTLSDLLITYKDTSGATQLELFDGRLFDIVESAKVVRRSTK